MKNPSPGMRKITPTSEIFALATRCPLQPRELKQLLDDLEYENEKFGSKTDVTEVIIFLSVRGFLPPGIIQTIDISFAEINNISEIMNDPIFQEMSVIGNNKEMKVNFKKLTSNLRYCPFVFRGRECGYKGNSVFCAKHIRACRDLGNEARFGGFRPNPQPQKIPKIPEVKRTLGLFPENIPEKSSGVKAVEERLRQISSSLESTFLFGGTDGPDEEVEKIGNPPDYKFLDEDKILARMMKQEKEAKKDYQFLGRGQAYVSLKNKNMPLGRFDFDYIPIKNIPIENPNDEYGKGEPTETFKIKKIEQLICPDGITQSDWNSTPTTIKKMILKRLGYNKEKKPNEDINRAIDL